MALQQLQEFERRYVWDVDLREASRTRRMAMRALRTLILLARDLTEGDLTMRAMSLVYTTLLSLVPLLALSFSVLKGFGVQNRLDDTLRATLEPLGPEKATQLADTIINFVDNMNVGVLGAMGLVLLLYTVVSLMQKIERSFNRVWRVHSQRSFGERFTTFLSAITVGPLLVFSALAITGSIMNNAAMSYLLALPVIGETMDVVVHLVPFVLVITAFTFLYIFIPNTRVRFRAALAGGVVAGVLWELLGFGFASFASGASRYQAIYATFASAILFLIWLYLNWLILLIGASIAFYRQHPEVVSTGLREVVFSPALTDQYALSLLARVGRRFYGESRPYTLTELAQDFDVPSHALEHILGLLTAVGVLAQTDEAEPAFVPRVPLDSTRVVDVLGRLHAFEPPQTYSPPALSEHDVTAVLERAERGRVEALADMTLKELALQPSEGPAVSKLSA